MLAFIGWQHEHEHQQLAEIRRSLKGRGVEINESNVGKLYRQFLALLGGTIAHTQEKLAATAIEHSGLIWATVELRDFGQYQVLFLAESEEMLLAQKRLSTCSRIQHSTSQISNG
ncbi:MAG: hypothetical protein V7L23_28120 [Nostoc sp.]|uniref:hypothetical protein n=1 Tax=Nostoc sp. TaxID=1180 RepID=UPI002FEEBF4C